jgi:GNAT superfamily N-acetyltransferase
VLIRSFAWADYEAVTALWQSTGREVVPRAELTAKLARDPELFLVAEGADAAIAGVVMGAYDGRRGWILRLAADPGRRRAGIASALVTEVETRLAALGCPRINLPAGRKPAQGAGRGEKRRGQQETARGRQQGTAGRTAAGSRGAWLQETARDKTAGNGAGRAAGSGTPDRPARGRQAAHGAAG